MTDRLQIHGASLGFGDRDDNMIDVNAYVVFDYLAGLVRWASLSQASCERWIDNHGYEYPDSDDEDGLS